MFVNWFKRLRGEEATVSTSTQATATTPAATAPVPAPAPKQHERRRTPRYEVGCPASLLLHDRRLNVKIVDVSLGGLQCLCRFEPEYQTVFVEIEVSGIIQSLVAEIVRIDFEHGLYTIGAQFHDLSDEQEEHLRAFIANSTRRHRTSVA